MIKLRFFEIEGTAEEVLKVREVFDRGGGAASVPVAPSVEHDRSQSDSSTIPSEQNGSDVTPELVIRVLSRRHLYPNVRKLLKYMLRAGSKRPTTSDIAEALNITRNQLSGVFGALGRREGGTPGWPKGRGIVEWGRDDSDLAERRYYLPDVVRGVLESGKFKL